MTATAIHPIFARENELRAAAKAIASDPLYINWESPEFLKLEARLIEIQSELKALYDSNEYIDAITPFYAVAHDCYGGI